MSHSLSLMFHFLCVCAIEAYLKPSLAVSFSLHEEKEILEKKILEK